MNRSRWIEYFLTFLAGLILGLVLAVLDGSKHLVQGWLAYGFLSSLAFISFLVLWRWVGSPSWLAWLLVAAFILHLVLAVTFSNIFPLYGYDTEVQNAGYIAIDAYSRDLQSWELASSERPIMDAFDKDYAIDQYGGLEAMSALVYRYLSPDFHRPWLIILLGSWMTALGMAFLWQASRMVFDEKLATLAVWMMAFYPEGVWLGSSQLREPFLMAFVIFAFYGVTAWIKLPAHKGWPWLLVGLLGLLLFSPGISIFLIVMLGGWVILENGHNRIPWKGLGLGLGITILALLLFWVAQSQGNLQGLPLWETISGWFKYTVNWDIYQLERDSGMIQYLFRNVLPQGLKLPFVFISSLRAGGDQWDNPRYRAIFLAFQALLAAKAWLSYSQSRNPWFIRIILVELGFVTIFSLWYASRYTSIIAPLSFPVMVASILGFTIVILFGGWLLDRRRRVRIDK